MADGQPQPIIKKIKKVQGGGHHGGAWKVAYADFVTAMMAFFLLMWLLNATSEEQKRGITNYFAPTGTAVGGSGSGGILGGLSAFIDGAMESMTNPPPSVGPLMGTTSTPDSPVPFDKVTQQTSESPAHDVDGKKVYVKEARPHGDEIVKNPSGGNTVVFSTKKSAENLQDADKAGEKKAENPQKAQENMALVTAKEKAAMDAQNKKKELEKAMREQEDKLFKETADKIRQAIHHSPDLQGLEKNIIIKQTPEGLMIQIVDQDKFAMFPLAGAKMYPHAKKLFAKVVDIIIRLPNKVAIAGYTDANPYSKGSAYTNWDLSSDRANASRRVLVQAGLPTERVASVTGKGASDPLDTKDPYSPRNRRITITLLRQVPLVGSTQERNLADTKLTPLPSAQP